MLRRTKEVLKTSGVVLPARRVHRVLVEFSARERQFYDRLHRRVGQRIEKMILEGGGSQYMSALLQLLRLRQICDDLRLVTGRLDEDDRSAVVDASVGTNASSENVDDLADMLKSLDVNRDLEDVQVQDQVQEEPMDAPSAKIIKLVSLLKSELSRKTIVFSQFTSMLDIMEPHLRHEGIRFVRYDGSMTPAKRDESLNALRNNADVEVLLCSLKCGALGLNLTCASRVILVDPWWNPMISEQAIDRVHRLGQTHDVDVYELIVDKTVEQKICSLCDSKRQLASGVIDGAQSSAVTNKLSKAELLDLFN
jgi:SNF2 family DNA or RNA helicase